MTTVDLAALSRMAAEHQHALADPVGAIHIAGAVRDLDADPLVMGVVNLSRDSTYRPSVAVSAESAVRRASAMHAQGAEVIDIGAESSTARAARVHPQDQADALVPVVRELAARNVPTSVEAYDPGVVQRCLAAGASVLNLTGSRDLERIYELAAEYGAAVVLCYVPGDSVRDLVDAPAGGDPLPHLVEYFRPRLEQARAHGLTDLVVDPGLGFYYPNLTDPLVRVRHQTQVLVNSFRLRTLGVPVCQALPHAFDLFEEEYQTAEPFFAVLAALGGVHVLRTHEVTRVTAVLRALRAVAGPQQ